MTYGPQSGSLCWRRMAVQLLLRMAKPGIMLIPMKTLVSLVAAGVLAGTLLPAACAQNELPASPSDRFNKPAQTAPSNQQPAQQPSTNASGNDIPTPDAPAAAPTPANVAPKSSDSSADGSKSAAPEAASATPKGGAGDVDTSNPVETFRANVNRVNVIFTVTDKHGKFVKDLTRDDFRVTDDAKPAASIEGFSRETNLPLRVGLLIDASNSIRERFTFEQEAAIEFLNSIVRPRFDRAFVIGFDTTPEITADFTDNGEKLARGVRMLRPGGGTALWDAIYFACRDKLMKEHSAGTGTVRRAIILLSDGDDNQSRVTREEAIEMAQRAEVIIYAISTNVSGVKLRGDKYMERIAEATGGRAFFPFKIQDVANAFTEIQDELRSQYSLAYKPSDLRTDGKYHSIDIIAQNHKNLKVRARKGYFAPKTQ
jgi:Ca-activated chloride channel homolog